MKGDFTRDTFDSTKHYQQVLMQQGRAQLDADWNEEAALNVRRDEATTADLIGNCGGPADNAAFAVFTDDTKLSAAEKNHLQDLKINIPLAAGDFFLSAGRYYVDGTQCENEWAIPFTAQPDRLDVAALAAGKSYLLYLDVWERHITVIEDPEIREQALGGPDTATRVKTVWQVRTIELSLVDSDNPCGSGDDDFVKIVDPGTAKLTADTTHVAVQTDPCLIPPSAGYTGLENQLYRVEIHEPGKASVATWKWSRENGSVVTPIQKIDGKKITVSSLGPDKNLGISPGAWVEILDDALELEGKPGQLLEVDDVDQSTRVITLKSDATKLTANTDGVLAERHPKLRRWEGMWPVKDATKAPLENGVEISFDTNGDYHTGHFWQIPARTATAQSSSGDIEWPVDSSNARAALPPRGITHHFCRLGIVTVDGSIKFTDCRCLLPALTAVPRLFYVSGDGQELPPNPTAADGFYKLPQPLIVGVANAQCLKKPLTVGFAVTEGNGGVVAKGGDAAAAATTVGITTDAAGLASCDFYLDKHNWSQQVTARLLDANSNPVSLPLIFNANLNPDCDCTLCVTAEQFKADKSAIQTAVEELIKKKGGTICLGPGTFELEAPILLSGAQAVRIRGQGAATILIQPPNVIRPTFIITGSNWCTLDYLTIYTSFETSDAPAIQLSDSAGTTIERVSVGSSSGGDGPVFGILLGAGSLAETRIRDNFFAAQNGVFVSITSLENPLTITNFYCLDNTLHCSGTGIYLAGHCYFSGTVITRNVIEDTGKYGDSGMAGILVSGTIIGLEVAGNTLSLDNRGEAGVAGIVVTARGPGDACIRDNHVASLGNDPAHQEDGIRLDPGFSDVLLNQIVITGNRLEGLSGNGIAIEATLNSALVEGNIFNKIGGNGLVMLPGGSADRLSVLNNQLTDVATGTAGGDESFKDGVSTADSTTYRSTTAKFVFSDLLSSITGANIPDNTYIAGLESTTTIILSNKATVDGTFPFIIHARGLFAGIYLRGVSEGAVSGNQIGIGTNWLFTTAGVVVQTSSDVRISDNTITNNAPALNHFKTAFGLLVFGPFASIEVADNLIRPRLLEPDADYPSLWYAILIVGTSPWAEPITRNFIGFETLSSIARTNAISSFAGFETLSSIGLINAISSLGVATAPGSDQVGITGNSLHGYNEKASFVVWVESANSCRFSDNYCSCIGAANAAVLLYAASVIVSANRVECSTGTTPLAIPLDVHGSDAAACAVLGNIVQGSEIFVNGKSLAEPWRSLNVVLP